MLTKDFILSTIQLHKPEIHKFGIHEIGLFGSYARGEESHTSDIDILIDFEPGQENFDNYMAVYDYLEHLFKDEPLEIVTRNGLSRHIGPMILNEVVYV